MAQQTTLGVIFGNRDFFPDHLVGEARSDLERLLARMGIQTVMLSPHETKLGGVETYADARKCAELFAQKRSAIDGVLVCLPNFGDEKGVLETLKLSGLKVPILVQGYPDDLTKLDVANRRDAFCGKISACNNLKQAGIPFSLTTKHVVHPNEANFREDLERFVAVCRVVNGLRKLRIGAVGARPGAFNTVRYSEKILEKYGIGVTTVDLSEILGKAAKLADEDARVTAKIGAIRGYANADKVPGDRMLQLAKFAAVLDEFAAENDLQATAVQCWTSIQQNYGCNACTAMSMMSQSLMPSACEVDVTGAVSMYALQLASATPSALVDWNNNYGDDGDRCVLFHCGNWPKSFLTDVTIGTAPILGSTIGEQNTYGTLHGRAPASALTYARFTTRDDAGTICGYVGEGELTSDALATFGARAVARVPGLQTLLRYICENGFEHHVAMNASKTAGIVEEACGKYLGWEMHRHG